MDDALPPVWGIPDEAQGAVLLDAARRLMLEGAYDSAVGLAEELLDVDPTDTDALLIVADAAARYGHGEVALLAVRQARALGARADVLEAAALLASCQPEAALAAAESHLVSTPDDARAHAIRGQALEILGRLPEADEALARAHALRPSAYPRPLAVDDSDWDGLLILALSRMEDEARTETRTWTFAFVPAPTAERLRISDPPVPPSVHALALPEDDGVSCELYTRALTRGCADDDELIERLTQAVADEVENLRE
ncbi:MAG: hypothetical protein EXR71_15395 [Myxococcales bacterium]|nr:hypothetical protein [Myxococcales bacterium]